MSKALIILVLAVALLLFVVLYTSKPKSTPPVSNSTPQGAEQKSNQDINDSLKAVVNCNAVSIIASSAISPYDGKLYVVGHPCHIDWLVQNCGWKY